MEGSQFGQLVGDSNRGRRGRPRVVQVPNVVVAALIVQRWSCIENRAGEKGAMPLVAFGGSFLTTNTTRGQVGSLINDKNGKTWPKRVDTDRLGWYISKKGKTRRQKMRALGDDGLLWQHLAWQHRDMATVGDEEEGRGRRISSMMVINSQKEGDFFFLKKRKGITTTQWKLAI